MTGPWTKNRVCVRVKSWIPAPFPRIRLRPGAPGGLRTTWIADRGEGPSIREIGLEFGLSSTSSVAYQLRHPASGLLFPSHPSGREQPRWTVRHL
ncbi:LexA family protein [Streptomyces sp. SID1121]|uniref:LexA family protein n=1 Tax=Streptomyces sp. SID1121 TaxID=3425888 RepID=UPI004055D48D